MTSTSKLYRRQSGVAWRMFATLLVLAALASPGQQQQGRGHKRDTGEIARQNRITEQILAQFLHRRLFPQAAPQQMRQGQLHNAFRRPWPVAAPAEGWEWEGPGREVGGRDREGIGHTGTGGRQEDSTWDEEYYDAGEDEGSEDGDGGDGQEGGGEEGGGGGEEGGGEEGGGEEGGGGESGGELGGGGDNRGGGVVEGLVGTREGGEEESGGRFYNILGDGFGRVNGRGSGRRKGGEEALETEETENISSEVDAKDCANCVDESSGYGSSIGSSALNRWTMPLLKLGEKRYYLGIFFKANWYRAAQYCRYHGMHLASIESQEESDKLEKHIRDYGLGHEHFWTSGTDQGEEGVFFWLSTGRPVTYTNWNAGEPNNFRYENGEEEHCLELWNRDGKGLKWNDTPCSFETFFVCEVQ